MIHCGEVAEAQGEALRLDGDVALPVVGARRNRDRPMATAAFLRQERDEGLLEIRLARPFVQLVRRAGGQDPAGVHGDQPVETRCFLHIGGGDQHAHARAIGAYPVDKLPELHA